MLYTAPFICSAAHRSSFLLTALLPCSTAVVPFLALPAVATNANPAASASVSPSVKTKLVDGIKKELKKLPLVTSALRKALREWQENEGFPFRWVACFLSEAVFSDVLGGREFVFFHFIVVPTAVGAAERRAFDRGNA